MERSPVGSLNSRVMDVVNKVSAFKFGNFALENAGDENEVAAANRLRLAGERLIEVGETDLAAQMEIMANRLQKRGKIDSNATKKLRYETRMISKRP